MFCLWYVSSMQDRRDTDEDLAFDIGYALWRAGVKLDIAACRTIAARAIVHLKRSRWEFRRKEPERPHGSAFVDKKPE
jgi:hypothetical protein